MYRKCILFILLCIFILILNGCGLNNNSTKNFTKNYKIKKQENIIQQYSDEKYKWVFNKSNKSDLENLQNSADNGHNTSLLDPEQTALDFLRVKFNINNVKSTNIETYSDNSELVTIIIDNKNIFQAVLNQPVKKFSTGIWNVDKYRFIKL